MDYYPNETNPIGEGMKEFVLAAKEHVCWTDPNLEKIVRFRLLTDSAFPMYDVSYCIGKMRDGTPVRVDLPFDQLPKREWWSVLKQYAKDDNVDVQNLGFWHATSKLW